MASFNKCIIVGYLGRDPEARFTAQGTAVTDFSVATTYKRGENETTTWFKVTAWGKQAENAAQYLKKGSQVFVEGELHQSEWQDKENNTRTTLEVTASDIKFLSKAEGGNGGGDRRPQNNNQNRGGNRQQNSRQQHGSKPQQHAQQQVEEDDVPF